MSQNLQKIVKFQKFQLENLVDFEKCCKTHIFLQKSVPIQPKTSNILPKICQQSGAHLGKGSRGAARREREVRDPQRGQAVVAEPRGGLRVERGSMTVPGAACAGGNIGKISKILQIFSGLVLGCIKTKFCKKICV